jgi:hypothetical protein
LNTERKIDMRLQGPPMNRGRHARLWIAEKVEGEEGEDDPHAAEHERKHEQGEGEHPGEKVGGKQRGQQEERAEDQSQSRLPGFP